MEILHNTQSNREIIIQQLTELLRKHHKLDEELQVAIENSRMIEKQSAVKKEKKLTCQFLMKKTKKLFKKKKR